MAVTIGTPPIIKVDVIDDPAADTRLDYAGRPDGNPVYVGKAPQGTGAGSPGWEIRRLEYDASGRLVRSQTLTGTWNYRTTLAWEV